MAIEIRTATMEDLDRLTAVEAVCFPPAEAAGRESFRKRLAAFPEHFWMMIEDGRLISVVDGAVTDAPDLTDEMYDDAGLHDEHGAWQMIFGVETVPERRGQGCAETLLRRAVADAKAQGRKGVVLTCKERLIPFYARFGFVDEGESRSVHGGAVWYQMRLTF